MEFQKLKEECVAERKEAIESIVESFKKARKKIADEQDRLKFDAVLVNLTSGINCIFDAMESAIPIAVKYDL